MNPVQCTVVFKSRKGTNQLASNNFKIPIMESKRDRLGLRLVGSKVMVISGRPSRHSQFESRSVMEKVMDIGECRTTMKTDLNDDDDDDDNDSMRTRRGK